MPACPARARPRSIATSTGPGSPRTRQQVRHLARTSDLPDGTFVQVPETPRLPMLIWEGHLHHLSLADQRYLPAGPPPPEVTVLTPAPVVEVLRAGYRPMVHRLSEGKLTWG